MSESIIYRGWHIGPGAAEMGHHYAIEYHHDDFDGTPDAFDNRCGYASSIDAAKAEIDDHEAQTCPDCGQFDCNTNH